MILLKIMEVIADYLSIKASRAMQDVVVVIDRDGDIFEYKAVDVETHEDSKITYICFNCPEK